MVFQVANDRLCEPALNVLNPRMEISPDTSGPANEDAAVEAIITRMEAIIFFIVFVKDTNADGRRRNRGVLRPHDSENLRDRSNMRALSGEIDGFDFSPAPDTRKSAIMACYAPHNRVRFEACDIDFRVLRFAGIRYPPTEICEQRSDWR